MNEPVPSLPLKQTWRSRLCTDSSVSMVAYPGSERHSPHRHDCDQLTIQLAGTLKEKLERKEYWAQGVMIGFKPAGALHADEWGGAGALLFTISLRGRAAQALFGGVTPGWSKARAPREIVQMTANLAGANAPLLEDSLPDLVALCGETEPTSKASEAIAPQWLVRVREALCDDPVSSPIAALARREDVHRVYLAREFRRYFGLAPSQFRRSQMASRLAFILADEELSLAECAIEGGFCDQSHASRVFRRETGMSLSQWRQLLRTGEVSSVQDRDSLPH